jgi:hypothetical protein
VLTDGLPAAAGVQPPGNDYQDQPVTRGGRWIRRCRANTGSRPWWIAVPIVPTRCSVHRHDLDYSVDEFAFLFNHWAYLTHGRVFYRPPDQAVMYGPEVLGELLRRAPTLATRSSG